LLNRLFGEIHSVLVPPGMSDIISSGNSSLSLGDLCQHITVTFLRRRLDRRSENDRALFPCLQHESHPEIKMTPFALVIPNDMYFIALQHRVTMRPVYFQSDPIVSLVDITRWIVDGNAMVFEFGDVPVRHSLIFFTSIAHRTNEIDVHEIPFP
jgi:hypothetical protein